MQIIQSLIRKLLVGILAMAGVADVSGRDVPRLVAEVRAISARALQAVSVDGTWRGTTGQGRQVTLDLKADGSKLTGALTLDEQSAGITGGTIEQRTVSFQARFEGRTATFTGNVAGDELTLTMEGARNPVTLRRVK